MVDAPEVIGAARTAARGLLHGRVVIGLLDEYLAATELQRVAILADIRYMVEMEPPGDADEFLAKIVDLLPPAETDRTPNWRQRLTGRSRARREGSLPLDKVGLGSEGR